MDREPVAVLIVGDFASRCGPCGQRCDPTELTHTRILGRGKVDEPGCGVRWTHLRADEQAMIGAARRARELRPDLPLIGGDD